MLERSSVLAVRAAVNCDAVQLTALPPCTRFIVRCDATAAPLVETALQVALSTQPCRATSQSNRHALWLGPDEWMVLAPEGSTKPVIMDMPASIVDVSHRNVGISITGPQAVWAINASCALDLHLSAFPVGMCTRTVFGKSEIILWRTDADTFRIEAVRSFAPYVWDLLKEACHEFLDGSSSC